jgi:predicted enzyme related to lactoylglutathione lyase
MANQFAHIELTTSDLKKAKQFYAKLFAWKLTDMPMGSGGVYTMIAPGKGAGGGMQAKPMPTAPVAWLPYVEVDDVKKSLTTVAKLGGKIALPATDIETNGTIGVFIDPAGAMLGVWAPVPPVKKAPAKAVKKAPAKPVKKAPAKAAKKKK